MLFPAAFCFPGLWGFSMYALLSEPHRSYLVRVHEFVIQLPQQVGGEAKTYILRLWSVYSCLLEKFGRVESSGFFQP